MRYSLANLAVREIASVDKKDVALHRVHFEPDGTTAATNGRAIMAVGPPDAARAANFPNLETDNATPPPEGVGVPPAYVAAIARTVPSTRAILKYAQMTRCGDREVELMTTNGHEKLKRASLPCRGRFPKWRPAVGAATRAATVGRICVDRMSLIKLLQALERAAPDKGNHNPVFIEFGEPTDPIVLRSENVELGQRAIGIVRPLDTDGYWLEADEWEDTIRKEGMQTNEDDIQAGREEVERVESKRGKPRLSPSKVSTPRRPKVAEKVARVRVVPARD